MRVPYDQTSVFDKNTLFYDNGKRVDREKEEDKNLTKSKP